MMYASHGSTTAQGAEKLDKQTVDTIFNERLKDWRGKGSGRGGCGEFSAKGEGEFYL